MTLINTNIIVSKESNDFILIYDKGDNKYYLYYQDMELIAFSSKTKPRTLDINTYGLSYTDMDNFKEHDNYLEEIENIFTEIKKKLDKPDKQLLTLKTICGQLYEAQKDEKKIIENVEKANSTIKDKISSLSEKYGEDQEKNITIENKVIDETTYKEFLDLLKNHNNNPVQLFDDKLKLYLGNSENLFKLIIHGLGAYLKEVSRLVMLNGGSGGGKSRLAKELENMMPIFENIGRSTFAYVSGIDDPYFYDGKIEYGGDKGLTIEQQTNFEQILAFLGELATDKYTKKGYRPNNVETVVEHFVNGLLYFVGEPYTNLSTFKASDQMKSRTTYITINPLTKKQSIQLRKAKYEKRKSGLNPDEKFEQLHKNYISYIVNNPIKIEMPLEYELKILELSKYDDRTTDYYVGLFYSYCQYLNISEPVETDLNNFLDVFYDKYDITQMEYLVYEKLYKNLRVLPDEEFEKEFKSGWNTKTDMLNSTANRKSKTFFTVKQVKTYFRNDFRMNKHLKDVIDSIGEILENLFNANLLDRLETPSGQENIYYIKYNEELEEKE